MYTYVEGRDAEEKIRTVLTIMDVITLVNAFEHDVVRCVLQHGRYETIIRVDACIQKFEENVYGFFQKIQSVRPSSSGLLTSHR